MRVARVEDRLDGVERAGADVSEDNPQSTDRESPLRHGVPVHGHSIRLPATKPGAPRGRAIRKVVENAAEGGLDLVKRVRRGPAGEREVPRGLPVVHESLERRRAEVHPRERVREPPAQPLAPFERPAERGHGRVGDEREVGAIPREPPEERAGRTANRARGE